MSPLLAQSGHWLKFQLDHLSDQWPPPQLLLARPSMSNDQNVTPNVTLKETSRSIVHISHCSNDINQCIEIGVVNRRCAPVGLRRRLPRDQKIPRKILRTVGALRPGFGFCPGQRGIGGDNHKRRTQNNRATMSHCAPRIPPVISESWRIATVSAKNGEFVSSTRPLQSLLPGPTRSRVLF